MYIFCHGREWLSLGLEYLQLSPRGLQCGSQDQVRWLITANNSSSRGSDATFWPF